MPEDKKYLREAPMVMMLGEMAFVIEQMVADVLFTNTAVPTDKDGVFDPRREAACLMLLAKAEALYREIRYVMKGD